MFSKDSRSVDQKRASVARISAEIRKAARDYFERQNFVEIEVPHITKATGACENVKTMFSLDYFGSPAYLAQTAQLYLETLLLELGKLWCVGPSFRAEPIADTRHLAEFSLLEFEFRGNFQKLLSHVEDLIWQMLKHVLKERLEDLSCLNVNIPALDSIKKPFPRIRYEEAINILQIPWGSDLKNHHEMRLLKLYPHMPLFITHFPVEIKFFNMRTNLEDPRVVNSADLILPFSGEAVGAAEREYAFPLVLKKLKQSRMFLQLREQGLGLEAFDFYLDHLKRRRNVLHSGGGIGLNRVVQFVLGSNDIRRSTVFPIYKGILM